jgi:predicted P-loop ATPase
MINNAKIKALHALGLSIILIREKSKAPVESGWTSKPNKTWAELKSSYKKGMNLGVRLGRASKLRDGTYLSVIDCDVKSTKTRHLLEMQTKLSELFQGDAPVVNSGRGGGSKHIYVKTRRPVLPFRFSQSSEKVKVRMPDTKPSRADSAALSEVEIRQGYRMRAAWEISVMGDGQQVVLPPSIHPDSGKAYTWASEFKDADSLPLVQFKNQSASVSSRAGGAVVEDFTLEPYDVTLIDDELFEMISEGTNVVDRSTAVFQAMRDLLQSGFTRGQVLNIFTERDYHLGQVAYDHTKSDSRKRAAKWLSKYSLKKAEESLDFKDDFRDIVEGEDPMPPTKRSKKLLKKNNEQHKRDVKKNWKAHLEKDYQSGKPKGSFKNLKLIFENAIGEECFILNMLTKKEEYGLDCKFGRKGAVIGDADLRAIKDWLVHSYRVEVPLQKVLEVIQTLSEANRHHPVQDYLNSLEWDGTERIDTWLKDLFGVRAKEPYLSEVSSKTLIAMVKRAFEPGCKFDHVLVLEGLNQGEGKSRAVEALGGEAWSGRASFQMDQKDLVLAVRSKWLIELSELAGFGKKEQESIKAFLSERKDEIRLPYGKLPEEFPRQCVFIGTTNKSEYLQDESGNRRYWPVRVGARVKVKKLLKLRNQLFAEAYFRYKLGEKQLWLQGDAEEQAKDYQKSRVEKDILSDKIELFLEHQRGLSEKKRKIDPDMFTMHELFELEDGAFDQDEPTLSFQRKDRSEQIRVGRCLRILGYRNDTKRHKQKLAKVWHK